MESKFSLKDKVIIIQEDYRHKGKTGVIIEVLEEDLEGDFYPYRVEMDNGYDDVFQSTGIAIDTSIEPKDQAPIECEWEVGTVKEKGEELYYIEDIGCITICDLYTRDRKENGELILTAHPNAKKHAHLIVKAVNNHDGLVEALKGMIDLCEKSGNPYSPDKVPHPYSQTGQERRDRAIEVLKEAKEKGA